MDCSTMRRWPSRRWRRFRDAGGGDHRGLHQRGSRPRPRGAPAGVAGDRGQHRHGLRPLPATVPRRGASRPDVRGRDRGGHRPGPHRGRRRDGHPGRHHRRDRLRPVHRRARGAGVPGRGPRPSPDRRDHHHARRAMARGRCPAGPAGGGGRRPGPGHHRALRHGPRPRPTTSAWRVAVRGSSSTPSRASTTGIPSDGSAGSWRCSTRAWSTACCCPRTCA